MRRFFETAVIFIGTLGFWGFVYPELCITEETFEVEQAEDYVPRKEDMQSEPELYQDVYDFLNGGGEICIKLRAVEYLYQVREKVSSKKD